MPLMKLWHDVWVIAVAFLIFVLFVRLKRPWSMEEAKRWATMLSIVLEWPTTNWWYLLRSQKLPPLAVNCSTVRLKSLWGNSTVKSYVRLSPSTSFDLLPPLIKFSTSICIFYFLPPSTVHGPSQASYFNQVSLNVPQWWKYMLQCN